MNKSEVKFRYSNNTGDYYEKIIKTEQVQGKQGDVAQETVTVFWATPKQAKWVRQADKLTCDLVPYCYADVSRSDNILLLSDEQDVEWLKQFKTITDHYTPTCLPDNQWLDDYAVLLKSKHIVIMLRRDDPMANYFATRLHDVAKSLKVIQLDYGCTAGLTVKNPGVTDWLKSVGAGSTDKLIRQIQTTPSVDEDEKQLVIDSEFVGIDRVLQCPEQFEKPYIMERIAGIRSQQLKTSMLQGIAPYLGITIEEAKGEMEVLLERQETQEDKIQRQEEASEIRLKGLIDIAVNQDRQKVFLILQDGTLKSLPFVDDLNQQGKRVRFIPPYNLNFLLPQSQEVLKHYGEEDPTLFKDLMDTSRRYVHLLEPDRILMISAIFLSYVIHHPDIHNLPILMMVSPANHGKSHVLKFIASTGYRGKWFRIFNIAACQRYNDEFQSVTCLDVYDFAEAIDKKPECMDFVLGKIEKGATIQKVNRPSAERYQQSDEYDPYGLLVVGSNKEIPAKHEPLLTRILPLNNILSNDKASILKPDNPQDFIGFRNRLTAWKARMMSRRLPDRGYLELQGRMFDMGQPFLQILNAVYPDGYEPMVQYLGELERRRTLDRADSSEATIVGVIQLLYSEQSLQAIREAKSKPQQVWISQRRLIDAVIPRIPKSTSRSIMKILRERLNLNDFHRRNNDTLILVENQHLDNLLKQYSADENQTLANNIPDTAAELLNRIS